MTKNIFFILLTTLLFASKGHTGSQFFNMSLDEKRNVVNNKSSMFMTKEEKKFYCLGKIGQGEKNQEEMYDAFEKLINEKECSIENITVLPKDPKTTKYSAVDRPDCKIKFATRSPDVLIKFELKKDSKTFKEFTLNIFKKPITKEAKTKIEFTKAIRSNFEEKGKKTLNKNTRFENDVPKNADDYYNEFRTIAQEKGACKPKDNFADEDKVNATENTESTDNASEKNSH